MNDKNIKMEDNASINETSSVKSSVIEDVWQNYDAVFKDAVSMFKDKSLDFFGLPKDITIVEPLKTETKEIIVKSEFADLTFKLSDGKGLHFESEVELSKNDLFRFCHYHIDLISTYGFDFTTVILVKNSHRQEVLDYKMLKFNPIIINFGKYDADVILEKMKEQVAKGEALNELELIYLPLFKSEKYNPVELLTESIRLINAAKMEDIQKLKISALAIVLSNKLIDANILEELWRELKMMRIKILEYAVEQGIQEGIEEGIEKGRKEGEEKGTMKIALKMLKRGKALTEILEDTELSEEAVRELAASNNIEIRN